jgi:hypothetical protein
LPPAFGVCTVLACEHEIARAALDVGADLISGHGPHDALPVELYRGGGAVFCGLFSSGFHSGHGGRQHGDWLPMMAQVELIPEGARAPWFRFARHNGANETVLRAPEDETSELPELAAASAPFGRRLVSQGEAVTLERVAA